MCVVCSRRELVAGAISTFVLSASTSQTFSAVPRLACATPSQNTQNYRREARSQSGNPKFDRALISELKHILRIMQVRPGFQYVRLDNAAASDDDVIADTKGTVWIGLDLINDLMKRDDGGVSVAGVLAHECAHIFQFVTPYYDRLELPTTTLVEFHADLLAGYYMEKRADFAPDQLVAFAQTLTRITGYKSSGHGRPGLRVVAMEKGYMLARSGASFAEAAREGEQYVRQLEKLL